MESDKESNDDGPGAQEEEAMDNEAEDVEHPGETAEERKKRKKKEKAKAKKLKDKEKKKGDDGKADEEEEDGGASKKDDGKKKKKKGNTLMKELLKLRKEQEERAEREAEENKRRQEEEERRREEQELLEAKRKEERKQKQDSVERQKKAYLTKKQKQKIERDQRIFANKDIILPTAALQERTEGEEGTKKKPFLYTTKKRKPQQKDTEKAVEPPKITEEELPRAERISTPEEATVDEEHKPEEIPTENVVESWEDFSHDTDKPLSKHSVDAAKAVEPQDEDELKSSEDEESDVSSDEDESSEEEEPAMTTERMDMVRQRLRKRREEAEARRSTKNLRSPVICVLGHVDTGKTKMLDTIRRTNVQDGEAGGITQQIGATRVPDAAIKERCRNVRDFDPDEMKIPGFLIIDTPGHESFSNLRLRGSSLCDFAILVVDIMHGLEQQTIESLQMLLKRKTPFVVALNKIDRLYDYKSNPRKDVWQHLKSQHQNTLDEFKRLWNVVFTMFSEQGVNVAMANENKDPNEYVSVIPTSAINGDGIGNLMAHIVHESQNRLAERLSFCDELDCVVMEVRSLPGLGMTIDVVLLNGYLNVNDVIILSGTDGPIATEVRDLLMTHPLREIRVKGEYEHHKRIQGAQGVKILAKNLEKAIAGLPLYVANRDDEVDILCEDARHQLESALTSIKKKAEGVSVQASTLGSLEALLEFLKTQNIPYANVNIGPVHKKDVQKTAAMLEHEPEFACILAFDVPVSREVQQFADREGVRIFQEDIIYHLESAFLNYREELRLRRRRENEHLAIFPCRLRILPQNIFNSRNPIVVGVNVEAGRLKKGTPIAAKTENGIVALGTVISIEQNHEFVEMAKTGDEVSVKIENTTGEAPKLYGRHFTYTDPLISLITRQSIDVCKQYFREDLSREDWNLIIALKKIFHII